MTLSFETMTPAGQFGDTCQNPVMDLRKLCRDDVLRSIPNFLGRWEDNTNQEIITDASYEITAAEDDCSPSTASAEIHDCTVLMPNQRLVSIGFEEMPYRDTLQRFCNAQRILRFPTLFNPDGSFRGGTPVADRFLRYLLSELRYPFMKHLQETAWNGDQTAVHQFEGILSQLRNGPMTAGGGCDAYKPVILDWDALVDGAGLSNPAATIDAASDAIVLDGVSFAGLTGLNMVEFLRLWMERMLNYELAAWSTEEIEFELWVGRGQENCILELAACMQPCTACVDPLSDPTIRDRAANFIRSKTFWLYPYSDIPIRVRTSPALGNTVIMLPKMIGGSPTIGWVFRNQDEELGILNGELPMYGAEAGLPDTTILYPGEDEVIERGAFETMGFSLHLTKNDNCIRAYLNTDTAIAIFALNTFLIMDNVNCTSLIPQVCPDTMPVAVEDCADGASSNYLDLDVTDLEVTLGFTPAAGDTFIVSFNDGITQLIGTVVSYTTGTEVLVLSFENDIVCTDYAGTATNGPATIKLLAQNS